MDQVEVLEVQGYSSRTRGPRMSPRSDNILLKLLISAFQALKRGAQLNHISSYQELHLLRFWLSIRS